MVAYYNEHDAHAAEWLRNLIAEGAIAPGEVDERDIRDVRPSELARFTQCHFFAGIGVWSYALRRAGWPDNRPVWTGSCPCQPFSAAGKGGGFDDERHLWPAWHWLIEQCRPVRIYGEQVASKDGLGWLDLVQTDLEVSGYASRAFDLCAAGFGAPHIRQRLFFSAYDLMADTVRDRAGSVAGNGSGAQETPVGSDGDTSRPLLPLGNGGASDLMANPESLGRPRGANNNDSGWRQLASGQGSSAGGLADSDGGDAGAERQQRGGELGFQPQDCSSGPDERLEYASGDGRLERWPEPSERRARGGRREGDAAGPTNGFWRNADWLGCTDGKWRPVAPGAFPLVDGSAFRMGSGRADLEGKSRAKMLRGYGNAIVAEVAQAFIEVSDDALEQRLTA